MGTSFDGALAGEAGPTGLVPGPGCRVVAVGAAVPAAVLANRQLTTFLSTSEEWISSRTGIEERRVAPAEMSVADLGLRAARTALGAAGLPAGAIDAVIGTSSSVDATFPSVACRIQAGLGCPPGPAFDLQAACTGMIYGIAVADAMVRAGSARRVLVVGSEIFTRVVDWRDRGTAVLFGDAAGAVVVGPATDPGSEILAARLGADGRGADALVAGAEGAGPEGTGTIPDPMSPDRPAPPRSLGRVVRMNGREVFRFSTTILERLVRELAAAAEIAPADLELVVSHQANSRILATAAGRLGLPIERFAVNVDRYGNTSTASVPLALAEAALAGRCRPGASVGLIAFGGGLTWGGILLRWGDTAVGLDDARVADRRAAAVPVGTRDGREEAGG